MLKNSLFQPSLSFSFSAAILFLFLFLFFTLLFCSSPLFLFFLCVALYFSAQNTFFSAQTFFSPKTLFSAQNLFFFFFQFSHSSLLLFSALFFSGSALFSLSAPPFFLLFSSVYPRPNVLFSCFTSLLFE